MIVNIPDVKIGGWTAAVKTPPEAPRYISIGENPRIDEEGGRRLLAWLAEVLDMTVVESR